MKIGLGLVVLGIMAALAQHSFAAEAHKHGEKAQAKGGVQMQSGEVLDMACYMAHEGKGAKHKTCAQKCIDGGAPAGLLTKEGKVYLLVEDHNSPQPYAEVKKWAAEQVKISGEVFQRGGVQAIVVHSAEKEK